MNSWCICLKTMEKNDILKVKGKAGEGIHGQVRGNARRMMSCGQPQWRFRWGRHVTAMAWRTALKKEKKEGEALLLIKQLKSKYHEGLLSLAALFE